MAHLTLKCVTPGWLGDRFDGFDEETAGLLHELRYRENRLLWGPPDAPFFSHFAFRRRLCKEAVAVYEKIGVPVPDKPLQVLRRTYGTLLARGGTPTLTLQAVMGHRSLATTKGYYIMPDAERDAQVAIESLGRFAPGLVNTARVGLGVCSGGTLGGKRRGRKGNDGDNAQRN